MEQFEFDLDIEEIELPKEHPSKMVRKYGLHAGEETCKTCKYLYRKEYQAV